MRDDRILWQFLGIVAANCPELLDTMTLYEGNRVVMNRIMSEIGEDLSAYRRSDPSQALVPNGVLNRNSPFVAIALHRLTHDMWRCADIVSERIEEHRNRAVALAQFARVSTGVEIHPGAAIGRRFVVDHGFGTVIGETVEIGDDCYILNGVTLGAR